MKKTIKYLLITVLLLAVSAGLYAWHLLGARYEYETASVYIYKGADESDVKKALVDALGNEFGSKVYDIWHLRGGKPGRAHGHYLVTSGTTALELARMLFSGRQTPVKLTFNNMRTFDQLAGRVGRVLEIDSARFSCVADSILRTRGLSPEQYPSAFLPDTYSFYWTWPAEKVVERLLSTGTQFWNEDRRAKAATLGLTPEQVATVASIVEEESSKTSEYPIIARLYLNRLDRDMALQADPTVKFAGGDFSVRRITGDMLRIDSPYNTYKYKGLPPGPIRIAERGTIDSVLNARPHKYLYMCAKSDFSGFHDFAETYDRHRINAARYHRALDRRGL